MRLERLFERPHLPGLGIPAELAEIYGGDLALATPRIYANFVGSVDGVVALPARGESGALISGGSRADRFVMGLLRACADAVLVGAGTFRVSPGHLWRAEAIFPDAAPLYARLRAELGLRPRPPLVLVTESGEIDAAHPALADAIVVTTAAGASRLAGAGARVVAMPSPIGVRAVVDFMRAEGFGRILTEGGPSLIGGLAAEHLLDELFLTVAPRLFGRFGDDGRKSLVYGADLGGAGLDLLSARRDGSFLFLRYGFAR